MAEESERPKGWLAGMFAGPRLLASMFGDAGTAVLAAVVAAAAWAWHAVPGFAATLDRINAWLPWLAGAAVLLAVARWRGWLDRYFGEVDVLPADEKEPQDRNVAATDAEAAPGHGKHAQGSDPGTAP